MTQAKTRRPTPTTAILADVRAARKLIDDRLVPVGGGRHPHKGRDHHQREANRWRSVDISRDLDGVPGWDSTLLAGLFGALAERDPAHVRSGLVRLAALAVAAVESLDKESE
ncbi:hypothetical protein ACFC36_15915 [Streptomyces rubiginosohelvolus]|uniref:hypothetical protein n=1 Tax=Streptomyces rubiginosohelvolus TaxID=67362 RepID=UPI0035D8AEAC